MWRGAIDCLSEWGPVQAGVPQGTKLGPWLFLLMINDLRLPNVQTWKYVDDTTVAEIVQRNASGDAQEAVSLVEDWSNDQNMQLNGDKCKVMVIDFKQKKHVFSPLKVDGKELRTVDSAKVLGLTLSSDLKWNNHITIRPVLEYSAQVFHHSLPRYLSRGYLVSTKERYVHNQSWPTTP